MSHDAYGNLATLDQGLTPLDQGLAPLDQGPERNCLISRRDLEDLLQSVEAERETGYRNLFSGIAASCGLGIASTVATRFDALVSAGPTPLESLFLIFLSAGTLAAGALAWFFRQRLLGTGSGNERRALHRHIRERLEQRTEPEGPQGYWP